MGLFDIFKKGKEQPTPIKFGEFTLTYKTDAESVIQRMTNGAVNIASGIYNNGLFTVLDTSISTDISNSWDWQFNRNMIPAIATAFGDLFLFCTADQKIYFFQTQYNTTEAITDDFDELLSKAFPFPSIRKSILNLLFCLNFVKLVLRAVIRIFVEKMRKAMIYFLSSSINTVALF